MLDIAKRFFFPSPLKQNVKKKIQQPCSLKLQVRENHRNLQDTALLLLAHREGINEINIAYQ